MTQNPIGITPFTIALAMIAGLELLFRHLFGNGSAGPWQQLALMGGLRLLQAVTVWFCLNSDGAGKNRMGLSQKRVKRGVWHAVLWCAGLAIFAVLGFWFASIQNWSAAKLLKTTLPPTYLGRVLFLTVGGVVGPVTEELVFRGLIYGFFRRWGFFTALFVSTLLFMGAHGSGTFWLVPLVGGVVFAISYEWSQSLIAPIIIHVAANLVIFSLSGWCF